MKDYTITEGVNEFKGGITNCRYKRNDIDLVIGSKEYLRFLKEYKYEAAFQAQKDTLTRNAIAVAHKMYQAGLYYDDQILELCEVIYCGYPHYLFSHYKASSKIFGLLLMLIPQILYRVSYKRKV